MFTRGDLIFLLATPTGSVDERVADLAAGSGGQASPPSVSVDDSVP